LERGDGETREEHEGDGPCVIWGFLSYGGIEEEQEGDEEGGFEESEGKYDVDFAEVGLLGYGERG